jgi:hypothetical protein
MPDTEGHQHLGSRHSHSEIDEVPKYGLTLKVSGDDTDTPSIKVGLISYLKELLVRSLTILEAKVGTRQSRI